jgi:hypothetical protein
MKIDLRSLTGSKTAAIVVASALSSAAGVAVGYTVATKRLELKYQAIADEEIAKTRQFYMATQKPATPQEALEQLTSDEEDVKVVTEAIEALSEYQGLTIRPTEASEPVEKPTDEEDVEHHNIFESRYPQVAAEDGEQWDYDEQLALRAELVPGTPYIISEEEYLAAERDYEQVALTYFAEDDVLVDEQDVPVEDVERAVGEDNLTKFGFGSKNENMVFIRNDRMEVEFEISKDEGSFAKSIGFDEEELEHSAYRGVRKFRDYDE